MDSTKVSFLLAMPISLKRWLRQEAQRKGMTITGLIMAVLSEYREQKEKTPFEARYSP